MKRVENLLKERRTVRTFKDKKVSRSVLRKVISAARWAPSMHNVQPWEFIVLEKDKKEELAKLLDDCNNIDVLFIRFFLKNAVKVIRSAPAVILAYNTRDLSGKIEKVRRRVAGKGTKHSKYPRMNEFLEDQSVACAIQNIMLAAPSSGLGTSWLGTAVFKEKQINALLGTDMKLAAIIAIGYPNEKPKPLKRKKLSNIITFK